jgi:E3 ISG15--protein ligase
LANDNQESTGILHTDPGAKASSRLFAWGAGLQGQLGLGTEVMSQALPKELTEIKDIKIISIAASNDLSAAIDDRGKLFTWGKTKGMMAHEQHGFTANLLIPTPLDFKKAEGDVFTVIACGRTHMAAVTADGKLYNECESL